VRALAQRKENERSSQHTGRRSGTPDTVARQLRDFIARTGAGELTITSQIFGHAQRLRSYDITADIQADIQRFG
jgi:alkanesulfonate monooxygenase SsuD/methylene tetrahydromethanopterin reductase-like flavin-dependent oxidoreductase (luciferase family)